MEQRWVLNILHVYWTDFDRSYLQIIITISNINFLSILCSVIYFLERVSKWIQNVVTLLIQFTVFYRLFCNFVTKAILNR